MYYTIYTVSYIHIQRRNQVLKYSSKADPGLSWFICPAFTRLPRGSGDTAIIFIKSRPIPGGKWVIAQEIQIGHAM